MEFLSEKIEKIAAPFLNEMGVDLVELNISRHRGDLTIRILADRPTGGITISECSELNKKIGDALETENVFSQRYALEVSSPALDRPLKTLKDFGRAIGREVRVFLSESMENKIEYAGTVKRIEVENVVVDINEAEMVFPITKINKAKQII